MSDIPPLSGDKQIFGERVATAGFDPKPTSTGWDNLHFTLGVDDFLQPPCPEICHGDNTTDDRGNLFAERRVYQMFLFRRSACHKPPKNGNRKKPKT
jgi:hypothetical protein